MGCATARPNMRSHTAHATEPQAQQPVRLSRAQFASLYEAYVRRVYGFVFSHVGNREDAEDVTSQVFTKAYDRLDTFEGRGRLESWLFGIARSAVADYWRERYKLASIPLEDEFDLPDGNRAASFDEDAHEERVRRLLAQL